MAVLTSTIGAGGVDRVQSAYLEMIRQKRLYGGLTLLIFAILMISGFMVAESRNAGGFWEGISNIGDYPAAVLSEAWAHFGDLPGLMWKYLPALIETVNIAAVSTLTGVIAGFGPKGYGVAIDAAAALLG